MTGLRRRAGPLEAALALGALLVACQPLPHPFADDRPPAALLQIRDSAGVSIAPVEGWPDGVAAKLGAATAAALLKRDIPASAKTASLGSYQLYGRVVESRPRDGKSAVTALWRLYDAKGQPVGERRARLEANTDDWYAASDPAIARLATLSADALVPLVADEMPAVASAPSAAPAPEGGRVKVAVGKIGGAPGDGAKSLAAAVTSVLKRLDLAIVGDGGKADLYLEGEVAITPVGSDKQHVTIIWRVRRADGVEIGTVDLENDVPRGLLDGPWGDIAYTIALAAGDGLGQLVARGAPQPPKS
jgi:hypothetical protein